MNTSSCFSSIWEFDHLPPTDASDCGFFIGANEPNRAPAVPRSHHRGDGPGVRKRWRVDTGPRVGAHAWSVWPSTSFRLPQALNAVARSSWSTASTRTQHG